MCEDLSGKVQEYVERVRDVMADADMVNHPPHYTSHPSGVECIQITEHMNFCLGNAFKYLFRRAKKHEDETVDMLKALWYVNHEIQKRGADYVEKVSEGRALRGERKGGGADGGEVAAEETLHDPSGLSGTGCGCSGGGETTPRLVRTPHGARGLCWPLPGRDGGFSSERGEMGQPLVKLGLGDGEAKPREESCAQDGLFRREEPSGSAETRINSGDTGEFEDGKGVSGDVWGEPGYYRAGAARRELEILRVAEYEPFNIGSALVFLWRADLKGSGIEDLKKAAWYIEREIKRRESK
jgi:hypothetical protein